MRGAYSLSLAAVSRVGSAVMRCQEILEPSLPLSTLSVPVYPAYSRVGMLLRGRGQLFNCTVLSSVV